MFINTKIIWGKNYIQMGWVTGNDCNIKNFWCHEGAESLKCKRNQKRNQELKGLILSASR